MTRLLFVYGTLKKQSRHAVAARLQAVARLVGAARAQGRLYDLSAYPAMVSSLSPDDTVWGEVMELLSPPDSLPWLDAYEGPAYDRRLVTVWLKDGSPVQAWCYEYTARLDGYPLIQSGIWPVS